MTSDPNASRRPQSEWNWIGFIEFEIGDSYGPKESATIQQFIRHFAILQIQHEIFT
jgi:hypothetical protein